MKVVSTIRLSDDVAEMAAQLAESKGLGHPKVAIEAVFRTCWQRYLQGECASPAQPAMATPTHYDVPINAASALDEVL